MKKLMFAVAALAAGVACAEITSANVVGYQTQGYATEGYSIAANTFVPVAGSEEGMTLADIKPSADFISSQICFLKSNGANAKVDFKGKQVSQSYTYWTEDDEPGAGAGWYLVADEEAEINQNDISLPFGDGFLVFRMGDEPDATLTYAGQVKTAPTTKGFEREGYSVCGNCTPAAMTLGDITVNSDFISSQICFLKSNGANAKVDFKGKQVSQSYTYWTEDDEPGAGAGWYLVADEEAEINQNDIPLAPGQGFMVFRMGDEPDAEITIPSAL